MGEHKLEAKKRKTTTAGSEAAGPSSSDATTLDFPCNSPLHDHKIEQGSETDKDSDATTLDQENASSSDGSYTDIHELDPDYDGPYYPNQACFGLHDVSYTPGWRRHRDKAHATS